MFIWFLSRFTVPTPSLILPSLGRNKGHMEVLEGMFCILSFNNCSGKMWKNEFPASFKLCLVWKCILGCFVCLLFVNVHSLRTYHVQLQLSERRSSVFVSWDIFAGFPLFFKFSFQCSGVIYKIFSLWNLLYKMLVMDKMFHPW